MEYMRCPAFICMREDGPRRAFLRNFTKEKEKMLPSTPTDQRDHCP